MKLSPTSKQSSATTKKSTFSNQALTEIPQKINDEIIDFRSLFGTFCAPGPPLGRIWQPRGDQVNSGHHFYMIFDAILKRNWSENRTKMEPKGWQNGGKINGQIDVRRDSRKHRFLRALPHGIPGFAGFDFNVFFVIF